MDRGSAADIEATTRPPILTPMRLPSDQARMLRQLLREELGGDSELLLFGSRADDGARGGDVDLLVRSPRLLSDKVLTAVRLAARAERLLGGRRVDLLLIDPATELQPIHRMALSHGVPL